MSGFDQLLSTGKRNLTPGEGFTGLALAAVEADQRIAMDELEALATRLNDLEIFSGFGKAKLLKGAKKALDIYEKGGLDTLLRRSLAAIPEDQTLEAYETVVTILTADRQVTNGERKVLERIESEMEIPTQEARRIRDAYGIGS